ncbi:MAG: hypothetical protein U1F77_03100 [Kiritimatiellia bacterium]
MKTPALDPFGFRPLTYRAGGAQALLRAEPFFRLPLPLLLFPLKTFLLLPRMFLQGLDVRLGDDFAGVGTQQGVETMANFGRGRAGGSVK